MTGDWWISHPGTDLGTQLASASMERFPDLRRFWRVATVALGLLLITAACSSDDLSGFDLPDDQVSDSTATSAGGTNDAPANDEPPPPAAGDDRGAELVGRWVITTYMLPDSGNLTNTVGADPAFLEFGSDGTLSYNTGCNAGTADYATSGSYVVAKSALDDTREGQPITIGPSFQQTEIGCDGFLGDQDRDLPADMGAANRFRIDDDRLLLLNEFFLIEATKAG